MDTRFHSWAKTPPMGWNSWDCFGAAVNEEQTRACADYMAKNLKPFGWEYVIVDIQWYEPQAGGWDYRKDALVELDKSGRLMPAANRFPSAANGKGFKPLADYVHSLGLKFGLHIMRGIPKQAVRENLPILGTNLRAQDIADTSSLCPWNGDMCGVDTTKPGAQEYYDSIYKQMAQWKVDFIKVDDLSAPYHKGEIEAIRKAIDKCGRKIVFSTSPGETPLADGTHIEKNANMWRMSNDFWDAWPQLKDQFARCHNWTPFRGEGHWPDADMLPLGAIRQPNGWTNFTKDEQVTHMTLWCIARSPLFFGGYLPKNDKFTLSLITNPEVLAVNQKSQNSRQISRADDLIVWVADVPKSKDKYVALFNAQDRVSLDPSDAAFSSRVIKKGDHDRSQKVSVPLNGSKKLYLAVSTTGDGFEFDHSDWCQPVLVGPKGALRLTDLKWRTASTSWGETQINKSILGRDIIVNGQKQEFGIGTHSESLIEYDIPAGYDRFEATIGLDDSALEGHIGGTVQFMVYVADPTARLPKTRKVGVDLASIGLKGKVKARNLWKRKDEGQCQGRFEVAVPFHGAALYRLSPQK